MSVATKHTYQDYDPRQRLTGAVVLILFAIVLLPMLLSKSPDQKISEKTEPVVMEVTKNGKDVFVSRISSVDPVGSETEIKSGSSEKKGADKNLNTPASTVLLRPVQRPVAKTDTPTKIDTSKKAEKTKSAVKSVTPALAAGWIVQVGVFSESANASKKVSELKKKGFTARYGKVKTSNGTVTKVWIGPFKERKLAEDMQERLQHKTRQRGIVVKK